MKRLILLLLPVVCLAGDANITTREGGCVRVDSAVYVYDFETGIADDLGGNGRDGDIHAGAGNQPTHIGATATTDGGMSFDGDDGIDVAHPLNYNDISISMWIKTAQTGTGILLDNREGGGDGLLFFIGSSVLRMTANTTTAVGSVSLSDSKWHHIVGVYDRTGGGAELRNYVDGVVDGVIGAAALISVSGPQAIGHRSFAGPAAWFVGLINEVMVHSPALTVSEIEELRQKGLPRHPNP